MSDASGCGASENLPRGACPRCGAAGIPVPRETTAALVRADALAGLGTEPHVYCPTTSCPVVYFGGGGSGIVLRDALKIRVAAKESSGPLTVCYCFGFTADQIRSSIDASGRSTVAHAIRVKVRHGLCRCQTMNPTGRCCLADVDRVTRELAG